ncbi:MAG: hypothetical protein Harvfovirus3_80 [Harvfovirus sp.]|uniref:Uncharacterized protein n=1 Tax=Harvfovirus sp. TaxID=2487768 RepID=A0A3G5A0C4_9VIRU|nr:MAG: hypothetical protein Harvfovirus3_80 [Harvfovirus sp.]
MFDYFDRILELKKIFYGKSDKFLDDNFERLKYFESLLVNMEYVRCEGAEVYCSGGRGRYVFPGEYAGKYMIHNVSIKNMQNIRSIELEVGQSRVDKYYNCNDNILEALRSIYDMKKDNNIPIYKINSSYLPILEVHCVALLVEMKDRSDGTCSVSFEYDLYELPAELKSYVLCHEPKNESIVIKSNALDNSFGIITKQIYYTGDELVLVRNNKCKIKMNFYSPIYNLLIYIDNPNISVNYFELLIDKELLRCEHIYQNDCYVIDFIPKYSTEVEKYGINLSNSDTILLSISMNRR